LRGIGLTSAVCRTVVRNASRSGNRETMKTKKCNLLPSITDLVSINILRQPPPPVLLDICKVIKSALDRRYIWLVTRIYHDAAYMMVNKIDPDREVLIICHNHKRQDQIFDFINKLIIDFPAVHNSITYTHSGMLFLKYTPVSYKNETPETQD